MNKTILVLKALDAGLDVSTKEGHRLCFSENNQLGILVNRENQNGSKEEQLLLVDWSLNWFIDFCEKLPEETIFSLAASLAIMKI